MIALWAFIYFSIHHCARAACRYVGKREHCVRRREHSFGRVMDENTVAAVIGGSGYFGRRLCRALLAEKRGITVFSVDIHAPAHREVGVHYVTCDISSADAVAAAFKRGKYTLVFHAASYGMSGAAMLNTAMCTRVNVNGTQNIIDACGTYGVRRLVYTSTYNVVFGGEPIENGDETMPLFPVDKHPDAYAPTKARAESAVLAANSETLTSVAIRPAAIYGEGEERHFPRIVRVLRANLYAFTIGDTSAKVDWVHVDNVVHAHLLAAKASAASVAAQAFFISDDAPINNWEFLSHVVTAMGFDEPVVRLPVHVALTLARVCEALHARLNAVVPHEPFLCRAEVLKVGVNHHMSIAKARAHLGYAPVVTAAEGRALLVRHLAHAQRGVKQWAGVWWWISITYGLFVTAAVAYEWTWAFGHKWGKAILAFFVGGAKVADVGLLIFQAALGAHVIEAVMAWKMAKTANEPAPGFWFAQTAILGYPSMRLLMRRARLFARHDMHDAASNGGGEVAGVMRG